MWLWKSSILKEKDSKMNESTWSKIDPRNVWNEIGRTEEEKRQKLEILTPWISIWKKTRQKG